MRMFHLLALAMLAGLSACGREPAGAPHDATSTPAAENRLAVPTQLGLCASCHGRNGISVIASTPNLAGRPREELLAAMQAYLDGTRDYAPMRAMLGSVRLDERERLADWFAAQPEPPMPDGMP